MSDERLNRIAAWVVETCLIHGSTVETAYRVATLFVEGLRRET